MNKVGCDPEVFIAMRGYWNYDTPYEGIIPAASAFEISSDCGYAYNGDIKSNPAFRTPFGDIIVDGISLEYNPNPGDCKNVVDNMKGLFMETHKILSYMNDNNDEENRYDMFIRPIVPLDLDMLRLWGDPRLAMFGCDPDATIYGERVCDPTRINANRHPWRYFGGHVHIEWDCDNPREFFSDPDNLYRAVYTCDVILGTTSILLDGVVDKEAIRRRKVYGEPSAHRPQDWGLEYRYPTNSWLLSPKRAAAFLAIAQMIPELVYTIDSHMASDAVDVRAALISGNRDEAIRILNKAMHVVEYSKFSTPVESIMELSEYSVRSWREEWV